jgi:hypothetical protein
VGTPEYVEAVGAGPQGYPLRQPRNVPSIGRASRGARSRRAVVVVEEPAESLASTNEAVTPPRKHRVDEFVAETLVIPLVVVMLNERRDRVSAQFGRVVGHYASLDRYIRVDKQVLNLMLLTRWWQRLRRR